MAIEKVNITKVYKSDENKDGEKFTTKKGDKFWKVAIQTQEYGEKWFSNLVFSQDDKAYKISEGDERTLKLYENNGYDNWKFPSQTDLLENRVNTLETTVKQHERALQKLLEDNGIGMDENSETDKIHEQAGDDIDPDDIPF